jgi:hypothetical protein
MTPRELPCIPVEPIEQAIEVLSNFNKLKLKDIQLTRGGVPFPMKHLDNFRFTGLSNKNYVDMAWYDDASHRS